MNFIDFASKTFEQLSTQQLYQILQLRAEVFVVEQNCPYQDLDELDFDSIHVCGYLDRELVAYSRLIKPGSKYSGASIGRVIIKKVMRNSGTGKTLMHKSISECRKQWKEESIFISAQERLTKFYQDVGFVINSQPYIEDGIPHVEMKLTKIDLY
mgnify:CR=1 FL=1|tara:strand:+ start:68 stop:532 length:465 start_codon:yes stop_codon:yes gene_type:complete